MSNIIPEKAINFSVYYDGEDYLGTADGDLPSLEAMTDEVKGAGIAGKFDSVTLGHFDSLKLSLTWRTVTDAVIKLSHQKAHDIDLYAALQDYDAGRGEYKTRSLHVYVKAIPKTIGLGKLTVAEKTDTKTEFELLYIKVELDNKERIELDKLNYIFKVDGVDYLADVRSALGKD